MATLTSSEAGKHRPAEGALLPSSPIELNLLLTWPEERTRSQWLAIVAASIALHVVLFSMVLEIPNFVGQREPEQAVIVHHIPLYLPPDVMTQKEPNRRKISKQIDLADLQAAHTQEAQRSASRPSIKRFELPKQNVTEPKKSAAQILPEAPAIAMNQSPGPLPIGSPNGISAPPPAAPSTGPFQNIGSEEPLSAHPRLVPPKPSVQATINGLTQNTNGSHLIISDDHASKPMPPSPGSLGQAGAQHAAVELQSDPEGADFKQYLTQILSIVRANWRRVIPESARMGQLRGRTVVEFIITRDGAIPKLVTSDSSGSEPLDRAAVAGLSMSNPLPPLPTDFKGYQIRLAFSFAYNMPSQ